MNCKKMSGVVPLLMIFSGIVASDAQASAPTAKKNTAKAVAAAPDPVHARYRELIDHADGAARRCMPGGTMPNDGSMALMKRFYTSATFREKSPDKPVTVELPEDFYHPSGPLLTFDKSVLVISRSDPANSYLTITKTNDGILLEAKVALRGGLPGLLCVTKLRAVLDYTTTAPKNSGEDVTPPTF